MPVPGAAVTDADLLRAAIAASGLSNAAFARRVLAVDPSSVRAVLRGARRLDALGRRVCAAVIAAPVVAELLAAVPDAA